MKVQISAMGALAGAFAGAVSRAAVTAWYFGVAPADEGFAVIGVSVGFGGCIGLAAGAAGNPWIGSMVGALLGYLAGFIAYIPLLFLSCLMTLGGDSPEKTPDTFMLAVTLAGGFAGLVGGTVGMFLKDPEDPPSGKRPEPAGKPDGAEW
jgi:apolipoprotein N-acyltransferase